MSAQTRYDDAQDELNSQADVVDAQSEYLNGEITEIMYLGVTSTQRVDEIDEEFARKCVDTHAGALSYDPLADNEQAVIENERVHYPDYAYPVATETER